VHDSRDKSLNVSGGIGILPVLCLEKYLPRDCALARRQCHPFSSLSALTFEKMFLADSGRVTMAGETSFEP